MSYTKGELVHSALNEIGIADYDYDVSPEETESALRRLDSMMAEWDGRGLRLSYPLPSMACGSTLDEDSNIPDIAWEAVIVNLAVRLAPSYGKVVMRETKITAKNALNTVYNQFAIAPEQQLRQMPKGAGYKSEEPYSARAKDTLKNGVDSKLDLEEVYNNGNY